MPDSNRPGDQPPEVPRDLPPDYAEAYRRGYESAYARGASDAEPEETTSLESLDSMLTAAPAGGPQARPVHRHPAGHERRRWLAPVVLVGLVLLLLVTAYGFGRIFFSEVAETDTSTQEPDGVVIDDDGASPSGDQQPSKAPEKKYDGRVDPVAIGGASASCQADSGVDATGRRVDYDPSKVHDGDMTSAWRCDGSGVGERVTIDLPEQVTIGEVGLVAGYAKTDPRSGADRYAENNRITRVRWVFSDGSSVTQKLDGSATNRDLQTVRIPRTEADRVVIEILSSRRGPRDTVAISEVGLGAVVG